MRAGTSYTEPTRHAAPMILRPGWLPVIKVNLASFEGAPEGLADWPVLLRTARVVHGHCGMLATRLCVGEDRLSRSSCPRHGDRDPLLERVISPFGTPSAGVDFYPGLERSRNCADAAAPTR